MNIFDKNFINTPIIFLLKFKVRYKIIGMRLLKKHRPTFRLLRHPQLLKHILLVVFKPFSSNPKH